MWQDRLRKLEQHTSMSVKLQGEVDKYKVREREASAPFCFDMKESFMVNSPT